MNTDYLKKNQIEAAISILKKSNVNEAIGVINLLDDMIKSFEPISDDVKAIDWIVKNPEKEMHVHFDTSAAKNEEVLKTYGDTIKAYERGQQIIHTMATSFASTKCIDKGYRLFIHPYSGNKPFEIRYGARNHGTSRYIKPGVNIEKLIFAGEFGNDVAE